MKKKHSGPQIVAEHRQADVLIGQGKTVPEVCKDLEISEQTYYRWRQKYGGMSPDMIKQLRALQKENARLKKLVVDQALDICLPFAGLPSSFAATTGPSSLRPRSRNGSIMRTSRRFLSPRAVPGRTVMSSPSTRSCGMNY